MKSSIEQLKELSRELNLSYESQDWGIINSSADRVREFIDYYYSADSLSDVMKYQLLELIIASSNDAILENKIDDAIKNRFTRLITECSNNETFAPVLRYWRSLGKEDYPVKNLL